MTIKPWDELVEEMTGVVRGHVNNHERKSDHKKEIDPNNPGREQFDSATNFSTVSAPTTEQPFEVPNPFSIKVDLDDAVSFIERWEGAKAGEMKPSFAEAHLKNIAFQNYLAELKARVEAARKYGQPQIALPPLPTEIVKQVSEQKDSESEEYKKLLAAFAPLLAVQKLLQGDKTSSEVQEKATDIVNAVVNAAEKLGKHEGSEITTTSPVDVAKTMVEAAKELNPKGEEGEKPSELVKTIMDAARTIADMRGTGGNTSDSPLDTMQKVLEFAKSTMKSPDSTVRIQKSDGTFEEIPLQQYLLTELLKQRVTPPATPPVDAVKQDVVEIQNPDGSVKRIPAATYISELALQTANKKEEEGSSSSNNNGNNASSKLLATLVATVEQLSNNTTALERKLKQFEDPTSLINNLITQSEKWEEFRRKISGGQDPKKEEEEKEKERQHQLELERIRARKAQAEALARAAVATPVNTNSEVQPQQQQPNSEETFIEMLERSRHDSEQFVQRSLRDDILANFDKENNMKKKRGKKK